jgi:N-acetylglutamate synthase-like GNAT family acetyltransferase
VTHTVREATDGDADDVIRLLDAAMLEFDRERARRRVDDGDVLVAVVRGHNREERRASTDGDTAGHDERVVGACVLSDSEAASTEIEQIAVHRSRRGRGIGTSLVETAATRTDGPLVARFRGNVRPFYESLGFAIDALESAGGDDPEDPDRDRLRGVLR